MQYAVATTATDIELLTLTEAAAAVKVPRRTLQKYWRPWGLKAIQTGRTYKFRRSDIAAWITANETSGAAY
jgi:excisionase family DNA binding protein